MASEQNPTEKGNVANIVNRFSKMDIQLRKDSANQNSQRHVVACFSYVAQMDDELDLKEGDELEVLEDVEDGWARGEIKASTANPTGRGKIGLFPTNFVAPIGSGSTNSSHVKSKKEIARVMYKYDAANPDELSLPEGALITVLNKSCDDEGWYEGEYNGKRGLFPENFVKLLEPVSVNGNSDYYDAMKIKITIAEKPPPAVGATQPSQPPVLPAKPAKPAVTSAAARASIQLSNNQTPPIASVREFLSSNGSEDTSTASGSATHSVKAVQEERKSVIAGLQSKLFPSGKLPPAPHKGAAAGNQNYAAASGEVLSSVASNDELNRLSSLTKNRPKQVNKRPPSFNVQNSALKSSVDEDTTGQCITPSSPKTMVQPPTKSKNLPNFPSGTTPPNESHLTAKLTTTFAPQLSTAPLTISIGSSEPQVFYPPTGNNDYVSRQEFDAYCSETDRRIEELTKQFAEFVAARTTSK